FLYGDDLGTMTDLRKDCFGATPKPTRETRALPNPQSGVCGTNYFLRWPIISPRSVRRSTRVRFFSIAVVSNEMCGISHKYSAMNQTGLSVVIQLRSSKRARFTGRE